MPLLLPPLLLSACGGKDVPPEQYSSNDTALPALTSTLSSENIQFSHKEGSEDQPDSYVYSGLSSMTDTLASYVQALEEDGCSPIDTNGVVKELPDFSVSSGSVSMGKDTGDGGVFQLQIAWEGDTCTITPVYAAELRITMPSVQALTVSEAVLPPFSGSRVPPWRNTRSMRRKDLSWSIPPPVSSLTCIPVPPVSIGAAI